MGPLFFALSSLRPLALSVQNLSLDTLEWVYKACDTKRNQWNEYLVTSDNTMSKKSGTETVGKGKLNILSPDMLGKEASMNMDNQRQ